MSKPLAQESDSEDDPDYAPSDGADSESSDEEPETKRARTASPGATAEDEAARKKVREELWATFQTSVSDSAEAKKWRPPEQEASVSASSEPLNVKSESSVVVSTSMAPRPSGGRPGPRKPRTSLPSLPTQKVKKLSTLDKSAMDWQAHINAEQEKSGLRDELEANRRGGGYLEKVDFLKRVEERKDGAMEASKSSKRRRP